jgi:hypothetical protein
MDGTGMTTSALRTDAQAIDLHTRVLRLAPSSAAPQ